MKIHQLSPDEALDSLKSGPDGLSQTEALRRLSEYGPNQIDTVRGESLGLVFIKEFIHFFALILWLARGWHFSLSPAAGWKHGHAGIRHPRRDHHQRLVFVLAAISRRTGHCRPAQTPTQYIKALRDGKIGLILAADLTPGDVILLQEGDNVPADCRLLEAFSLRSIMPRHR